MDDKFEFPEHILFWAFRYALGRMTYVCDDVASAIIRHAPSASREFRQLVTYEIHDAIQKGRAGMSCDVLNWMSAGAALEEVTP